MPLKPDYATLAEFKRYVRIDAADVTDDDELQGALSAASRAIDDATDRQFGVLSAAAARYITPVWSDDLGKWTLPIDDLMDSTGLVVKSDLDDDGVFETTIAAGDRYLWPIDAPALGRPWSHIVLRSTAQFMLRSGSVEVTALYGWTAVPATIKTATLLQASRFYKRRDAPFGIAGSPELGNQIRLLPKADPDVEVMVRDYRVWSMMTTVG
jgi:hypothetical protein